MKMSKIMTRLKKLKAAAVAADDDADAAWEAALDAALDAYEAEAAAYEAELKKTQEENSDD
jgi:hypothetical protein